MKKVICYTSGEATGNPGPAAIGVYITDELGVMQEEMGQTIGNSTKDFAEYQAVLVGLQTLRSMLGESSITTEIELRLSSDLVKKQLNRESPINEPGFVPMFIEIHNMSVISFPFLILTLIPREDNKEADRLVNEALDTNK